MSVPQMPTRWTRTSASPGPGFAGSSMPICSNRPGSRNRIAFMEWVPLVRRGAGYPMGRAAFDSGDFDPVFFFFFFFFF